MDEYRGRRRAPEPPVVPPTVPTEQVDAVYRPASLAPPRTAPGPGWAEWFRNPRVAFLCVLVVVLFIAFCIRTFALGSSSPQTSTPGLAVPAMVPTSVPSGTTNAGSPSTAGKPSNGARGQADEPFPAVPPGASPVPVPSLAQVSYEAEAPSVLRSSGVEIRQLPQASGGRFLATIFDGRAVKFPAVLIEGGGDFVMTIFYIAPEPRRTLFTLNDGPPIVVEFPATGGRDKVGTATLKVTLVVGFNTVQFGSLPRELAPDLDKIVV
jgi:hypothetical protein